MKPHICRNRFNCVQSQTSFIKCTSFSVLVASGKMVTFSQTYKAIKVLQWPLPWRKTLVDLQHKQPWYMMIPEYLRQRLTDLQAKAQQSHGAHLCNKLHQNTLRNGHVSYYPFFTQLPLVKHMLYCIYHNQYILGSFTLPGLYTSDCKA